MAVSDAGVFTLLSELCKTLAKDCEGSSDPKVARRLRTRTYEILLHRGPDVTPSDPSEVSPVSDLFSYYYVKSQNARSMAEQRSAKELLSCTETIRDRKLCEGQSDFECALRFLLALKDEEPRDHSTESYQPFTFGFLDKLLPRLPRDEFGSPLPYQYYPPHLFKLPFTLSCADLPPSRKTRKTRSQVTVAGRELKTFGLPSSLISQPLSGSSIYSNTMLDCPRLLAPRNLQIPKAQTKVRSDVSDASVEIEEMFRAVPNTASDQPQSVDIWELVSSIDKNIPDDIWEIASRLPPAGERRMIASSPREMSLWKEIYRDRLGGMHVISEKQFMRHLMYLTIGIESLSFKWNKEHNGFAMRAGLSLEGLSSESIQGYVAVMLSIGTCYRRLYNFAFEYTQETFGEGYIFEAARNVVRLFLLSFRLKATEIYSSCFASNRSSHSGQLAACLPTLLQVIQHLEPLRYEIETVASIYKVIDADAGSQIPRGSSLMSYLYNEISLVTHTDTANTLFRSLCHICTVYFKFIERFIFEGELEDLHEEFFIRKEVPYAHSRTKRYWDRGFHIADAKAVPNFLRSLAQHILLCGKSFRLLKLCNPTDPLVLLISSDHPSVKCCTSFEDMERQQKVLDVYRTRCLFVSGEPVTFDQIMLKKEAERKAFTEMAAVKQAETLEKIVAERKRLAQLIIAEKQHNLRVLETAIAETEASRRRSRRKQITSTELERAAQQASDEADAILMDDEKTKMLEYYSKLNHEVEKRKAHTEWKIKRLQLDSERMKILSTEERNLKREKLELQHISNDDGSCSMSIYSTDSAIAPAESNIDDLEIQDVVMIEVDDNANLNKEVTQDVKKGSSEAVVSVPSKTLFDSEGNIMPNILTKMEDMTNPNWSTNFEFLNTHMQVMNNRQKVEYTQLDSENNVNNLKDIISTQTLKLVDNENNENIERLNHHHNHITQHHGVCDTFTEAKRNKTKIVDADNITELENTNNVQVFQDNFTNICLTEARRNRLKVLGTEEDSYQLACNSQITEKIYGYEMNVANSEAKINRQKALGTFNGEPMVTNRNRSNEFLTDAQKEALLNKQRVLGTEYGLEIRKTSTVSLTAAQEEAVRNKKKILGSEYGAVVSSTPGVNRRSALKLDLKKPDEISQSKMLFEITPTTTGMTPGDFYSQLHLETPTTAEVPFGAPSTADLLSPSNQTSSIFNVSKNLSEGMVSSDGFKFPSVILEEETTEASSDEIITGDSPWKILDLHLNKHFDRIKSSIWNLEENAYNFDNFDPFGVKGVTLDSKCYLSSDMDLAMKKSCYSNPADIIRETQKKPYNDIFGGYSIREDDTDCYLENANIATLTACFQRSVVLPLFYQLEMVNNSILTFYLMNLDMYDHLRSLKNYFFLMDGEFSSTICENLFQKLVKTINPEELLNFATLHSILDKALGSSIANVNKFSENLSFTMSEPPLSFQHSSPDVLQCLSLTYSVTWPMNIILSTEALARYSRCFQFLLKMRRISWMLGQDFEVLKLAVKLSPNPRAPLRSHQYNTIQLYRHIMASLIRALDNYIVTTCIHSSWIEFETDLRKARTLDDLHDCHVAYIKKVLFRCLLNKRSAPVMKLLNDVFTVILRFSHVLKTRSWTWNPETGQYVNSSFLQLQELFQLFENLTRHLHKTVSRLMECGYQPHLVELLTMINLNGYYDPVAKSPNSTLNITH